MGPHVGVLIPLKSSDDSHVVPQRTARAAVSLALTLALIGPVSGQTPTVNVSRDSVTVRAPSLTFLDGDVLTRLHDGQVVPMELTLSALASAGGEVLERERAMFNLSFDLWEERIAATRVTMPSRSVSRLQKGEAEAWCVSTLSVPVAPLAARGRDTPFWIRVAALIQNPQSVAAAESDPYSLRALIDYLSWRRRPADVQKAVEAGPFRLSSMAP